MNEVFGDESFRARFWNKVNKLGSGCWEWTGKKSRNGYGKFWFNNKELYAHRVSYILKFGKIPDGFVIDHLCRNRKCVNPAHLEVVTQKINVLRGISLFAKRKQQTHCVHGHLLDGDNLIVYKNGTRHCRACARIWDAARPKRVFNG